MSTPRPTDIQPIGEELAVKWSDGVESFFKLEELRRACPCAVCGGEPDVLGRLVKPDVVYNPGSFTLAKIEVVGGYALQPKWGDGHSTGLFSWIYLRKLDEYLKQQAHGHDHVHDKGCCGGHG